MPPKNTAPATPAPTNDPTKDQAPKSDRSPTDETPPTDAKALAFARVLIATLVAVLARTSSDRDLAKALEDADDDREILKALQAWGDRSPRERETSAQDAAVRLLWSRVYLDAVARDAPSRAVERADEAVRTFTRRDAFDVRQALTLDDALRALGIPPDQQVPHNTILPLPR